jgi:PBSX family phage terminase large subunit
MMNEFKKTEAQSLAVKTIINSLATDVCIEGGSRAGKSFEIMRQIFIRAAKQPNSDHLIVRETFNSAKRSLWLKTAPDVLRLCFPMLNPEWHRTDYYIRLINGSRIFLAGLDDGDKLERLLGTEYSTLWFNESNQIPFTAISKLKTRLAQKNTLKKMAYYDLNPTKTSSWVYQLFHQGINPEDGESLSNGADYLTIKMSPQSNIENLDENYIKTLERLPEKERMRFLYGEYDTENSSCAVYSFNDDHISEDAIKLAGTIYVGSDFNIEYNSDIILSQHAHGIYVWDEIQIPGDTFKKAHTLKEKGATGATIIADSTGINRRTSGKSDFLILREAGFNVTQTLNPAVIDKIANLNRCFTMGLIKINPRCRKLTRDLKSLKWDRHGQLNQTTDKSLSHLVDCLAYVCWKMFPLMNQSGLRPESHKR